MIHLFLRYAFPMNQTRLACSFLSGLLIPFGFAPFHLPGLAILGIAILFFQLNSASKQQSFFLGFIFGLGFFGFGISWIYVSIHDHGYFHPIIAGFFTLLFVAYLALFTGIMTSTYVLLNKKMNLLSSCILFSALWCGAEVLRSTLFGGFPWLLLGFSQMDTPLQHVLPLLGVYGVSYLACLSGCMLGCVAKVNGLQRAFYLIPCVLLLTLPLILQHKTWTTLKDKTVSVGIIQANIAMRDKWDESLFWKILEHYEHEILNLIQHNGLVVMPEAAIPLPTSYLSDFFEGIDKKIHLAQSALLLGVPHPTSTEELSYYNAIISLGQSEGVYYKQHLVPFGEFTPKFFQSLSTWLGLVTPNMSPGEKNQPLMRVHHHPIATLICYELAYPNLLRAQLPEAEWIVSVNDDGWFGRSLALYQHLQMAQVLSKLTGRYQIVSNNDGLSSIINDQGIIVNALPAFSRGILESSLHPATGASPWVQWGDLPALLFFLTIMMVATLRRFRRKMIVDSKKAIVCN